MKIIEIRGLTKDYGRGKGVFDVSLAVEKGEVFGFLGPNGAGKTTTIRQLMGFIKPDRGSARINGMDCFRQREQIQKTLGYLPGEIALMDEMTGREFLKFIANMKGMRDRTRMEELIRYFELDPRGKIRRMSKGMKQKLGLICAFMQSPEILLLDEPSSGLDPLMQNRFIDLLMEEKKRGVTVFLSSHIFEEVERTCDQVAFIREGRLAAVKEMVGIRQERKGIFDIYFANQEEHQAYLAAHPQARVDHHHVTVTVAGQVDAFLKELSGYTISDLRSRTVSLEELFLQYYSEDSKKVNSGASQKTNVEDLKKEKLQESQKTNADVKETKPEELQEADDTEIAGEGGRS